MISDSNFSNRILTKQEDFWSGEFGDNYVDRNTGSALIASNLHLFSNILRNTQNVTSVLEYGANIGLNLIAIHSLLPSANITAVEINKKAFEKLLELDYVTSFNNSILDSAISETFDFVFTKGVLIHQDPETLDEIYNLIYSKSNRYICICEYFNPTPVEIKYRGVDSVLFKRDFAGEILNKFTNLRLVDYGFIYHRDSNFPGDDINWFLMEK